MSEPLIANSVQKGAVAARFHPALLSVPHTEQRAETADSFSAIQKFGTVARYGRNETIYNRGDQVRYAYRVMSGAVRLSRLTRDGQRRIADFALPGDLFGFDCSNSYGLTAEAVGELVVVRYLRAQIERAGDEDLVLRRQLMGMLRRGLTEAQDHLIMLTGQSANERVASFLLRLAGRDAARDNMSVEVPMRRQDIADYLGLTTETVCRAISEFRRDRVIAVPSRRKIVIRDVTVLKDLAGDEE
jgi:CRP/FNR family nitrogen fixation transcriptional regulator